MKILSDEVISLLNKKQEAAFEVAFNLYYPRLVYFAKCIFQTKTQKCRKGCLRKRPKCPSRGLHQSH